MKQCHGCNGRGWVDSEHFGPTLCPVCKGEGQLLDAPPMPSTQRRATGGERSTFHNKNELLAELEQWLQEQEGVRFDHKNKRMNTYTAWSTVRQKDMGLVWVYTDGSKRIHLRKGDYSAVDSAQRVLYTTSNGAALWGGYQQFIVESRADLAYAKKLIGYAMHHL